MNKGILMILDGYGEAKKSEFNAVTNSKTPTLNKLKKQSKAMIKTCGTSVGLFEGDMGGSEVGHTTIGAGRIIPSTAKLISDEVKSGDFRENKVLKQMLKKLHKTGGDLHLVGLCSDKNIHSNISHLIELIKVSSVQAKNVYIHFITDGRDTAPYDSLKYLKQVEEVVKNEGNSHILSVSGRFYGMDRENENSRIEKAFKAMFIDTNGINEESITEYILEQHKHVNDQYVEPVHINIASYKQIKKKDAILFFNFREDRVRQMAKRCENLGCELFTMAEVGGVKATPFYTAENTKNTLSEYLSKNGLKQVKISETTKYAHVTYFLNGGREQAFKNEDRVHVPTLSVDDFTKTPHMRAQEITNEVEKAIEKGYDAIIVNYSNPDMIGHTGDYNATVEALEFLDKCVKRVLSKAKEKDYFVLVTADHGNSEEMILPNGQANVAHTLNDVFCVVAGKNVEMRKNGGLYDIAPTFVDLLGLKPSKHFEGESLIVK